jgi:hypothetical protein
MTTPLGRSLFSVSATACKPGSTQRHRVCAVQSRSQRPRAKPAKHSLEWRRCCSHSNSAPSSAAPGFRSNIKSAVLGPIFRRPWHARSPTAGSQRVATTPQVRSALQQPREENGSDPPGLGPASILNSNGSLPQPRLREVSMWTSKFLNMSVKRKEIYVEFMRAADEFTRRLRRGLNGGADKCRCCRRRRWFHVISCRGTRVGTTSKRQGGSAHRERNGRVGRSMA